MVLLLDFVKVIIPMHCVSSTPSTITGQAWSSHIHHTTGWLVVNNSLTKSTQTIKL